MLCRLCKKVDKNLWHIVSGCSKLAEEECKSRHDISDRKHWKLARNCNFKQEISSIKHKLETVLENEDYKILLDFSIQHDHVIEVLRQGLVFQDKKRRICKIVDVAVPGVSRIE